MSDEERGPARVDAEPTIDALATVVVDGRPITTAGVPSSTTVAIHTTDHEQGPAVDDYENVEDVPEPAGAENIPDEPSDEFDVTGHAWVSLVVADDVRGRFTASRGETVALHLEPAEGDIEDPATWSSVPDPEGSTGENGGADA